MSDVLYLIFGCTGFAIVGVLLIGYIVTSASRRKSECPECGKKALPKAIFFTDESKGEKQPARRDILFAIFTSIGSFLIGLVLVIFIIALVVPVFGDDSCDFEGITVVCVSYGGGMKMETTINLVFAGVGLLGGLGMIGNGIGNFSLAVKSRGKEVNCEFECMVCKHTWTEITQAK